MNLKELQNIMNLLRAETAREAILISRIKELRITRYPNEQGSYNLSNWAITIELE